MNKITSILFPVDFKPVSYHAIDFVVDVSKRTGAFVTLFHADEAPAMADLNTRPLIVENHKKVVDEQFRELQERYPELAGVPHRFDSSPSSLERGIEYFLENKNERVDLIMIGTKGVHGVKEYFSGTQTMQVIDKSSVPVLVIPESTPFKHMKKIVFAYDYKGITNPGSLTVLRALADIYDSEVSVLNIAQDPEGDKTDDLASVEIISKEFRRALYVTAKGDSAEKEIHHYAMLHGTDMIAVMPREHGYFAKLFTETTTEKLAYHTLVPLLVMR